MDRSTETTEVCLTYILICSLVSKAFCPAKELPKLYPNKSAMEAFQEKDIVRGWVF